MRIIRESGLLDLSLLSALIMGDKTYRGKLGVVVSASKRTKVSKKVKELEALCKPAPGLIAAHVTCAIPTMAMTAVC